MSDRIGSSHVSNVNAAYNQEVNNNAKVDTSKLPPELQNAKKSGSKLGLALKITATILTAGLFGIGWGIYSLVKSCKKSNAHADNQANQVLNNAQANNNRVSNNNVQNNNVSEIHEQPQVQVKSEAKESFSNAKNYNQHVMTARIVDVIDSNYLNKFEGDELKAAVKTIVEDAVKRNPDAVNNLIKTTFSALLNINEQVENLNDEQRKNVLVCCVLGHKDDSHNILSCNTSSNEAFIESVKSLFEYHIPAMQEAPQVENNV